MRKRSSVLVILLVLLTMPGLSQLTSTYDQQIASLHPVAHLRFSDAGGSFYDSAIGQKWTSSATGSIAYQQASQIAGSLSASLTYNAALSAPNNSVGNFEWNQPFTIIVQIHNWQGSAEAPGPQTLVPLVSKGILGTNFKEDNAGQQGYIAYLENSTGTPRACIMLTVATSAGVADGIRACNGANSPAPFFAAGRDYNLIFTSDGSGTAAGLGVWINGFASGTVTGDGPAVQPLTVYTTGPAFTRSLSMLTPNQPLMVNGDFANRWASAASPGKAVTYDDVAVVPGLITAAQAESLFSLADWDRSLLAAKPAVPKPVIIDEDGCQDNDNMAMLAAAIRLDQMGYLRILGVNDTEGAVSGWYLYRKMLNAAGLRHVPLSRTPQSTAFGGSNAEWPDEPANMTTTASYCVASASTYDADIVSAYTDAPSDVQMYTSVLSSFAPKSVAIIGGGAWQGMYDVALQSGGLSLLNSKVAGLWQQDGGSFYPNSYGGNCQSEGFLGCQYILAHATFPVYLYGGGCPPMCAGGTGPGEVNTRGASDAYALAIQSGMKLGSAAEQRPSFDSWALLGYLQSAGFLAENFFRTGATGTFILTGSSANPTLNFTSGTGVQSWMQSALDEPSSSSFQNQNEIPWFMNSLINEQPIYRDSPQTAATTSYPATPNLVAHWAANAGAGLALTDSVGSNTMTGTKGAFAWGSAGSSIWVPIYGGSAGACAASPGATSFGRSTPFTISTWFTVSTTGALQLLYGNRTSISGFLLYANAGELVFEVDPVGGRPGANHVATGGVLSPNTTYNATVVYDGSSNINGISIYLNGAVQKVARAGTIAADFANSSPLCLGMEPQNTYGLYLSGAEYNTEVYNAALTPTQVQAIYKGWQ